MNAPTITVWDPLVRLFHWSLVASFAVAWLTSEDGEQLHHWAGYAAIGLVSFRVFWGLVGPRYARFSQFIRSPGTVLGFLRDMLAGHEPRYIGHNPAGGLMIVALLLTMVGTAITGWMYTLDAFWGEDWVEETHETLATVMLILVIVHVGGVLFASLRHRENLVRAMITGQKREPQSDEVR